MPWQTALTAKNSGHDRKIPAFWKTPDQIIENSVLCKTTKNSVFFWKKKKTAFRSAAVANIAIELRTAAAQAQGAGSRAVSTQQRTHGDILRALRTLVTCDRFHHHGWRQKMCLNNVPRKKKKPPFTACRVWLSTTSRNKMREGQQARIALLHRRNIWVKNGCFVQQPHQGWLRSATRDFWRATFFAAGGKKKKLKHLFSIPTYLIIRCTTQLAKF